MSRKCNFPRTSHEVPGRRQRTTEPAQMTGPPDAGPEVTDRASVAPAGNRRDDSGCSGRSAGQVLRTPVSTAVRVPPCAFPVPSPADSSSFPNVPGLNPTGIVTDLLCRNREPYAVVSWPSAGMRLAGCGRVKEREAGGCSPFIRSVR